MGDESKTPEVRPPEAQEREVEAGGRGGGVADAVRKVVMTGLGAVFLTEEGARKLARDWKLPKEIAGYVTAQASGAKDEIVRVVSEEVRKFFESPALRREFLRVLSSMSIEVRSRVGRGTRFRFSLPAATSKETSAATSTSAPPATSTTAAAR